MFLTGLKLLQVILHLGQYREKQLLVPFAMRTTINALKAGRKIKGEFRCLTIGTGL